MENPIRRLYRDQKKTLDLIRQEGPRPGFESAVRRLFGANPDHGKMVRIGNREFKYAGYAKNLVSFLPARWAELLAAREGTWLGCENWWAGYPLVALMEMRVGDDGIAGFLRLSAEVGPVLDREARKGIIEVIRSAAAAAGVERIQFQAAAFDERCLYSRFLRGNSIALNDTRDVNELERKFIELVASFEPEFELVASVVPLLPR